jgi:excisionase family DNA binding protein
MSIAEAHSGRNTSPTRYDGPDRRSDGGLFNIREAARYLSVSERKVQAEVAAGRIRKVSLAPPGAKKGPVRFRRSDLDAYIASCVVEPVDRRPRS